MSFNINKNLLDDKQFQELASSFAKVVGVAISKIKENAENQENQTPESKQNSLQPLVVQYSSLIGAKFQHRRKGTTYILNEILNQQTDDPEKTPIMVSYYDINKQTKWCRPLIEFHTNFNLVT